LVILDQFEEYFAHHRDEAARAAFAGEIGRCVGRTDVPANFLVAIREDAYAQLGDLFSGYVANVYGNYLPLEPLSVKGAEDAIRRPLKEFGVEPGEGLVEAVLAGIRHGERTRHTGTPAGNGDAPGEYVAAPYLQLVMKAAWEARDPASKVLA